MTRRPLHALLFPPSEPGGRLLAALAAALDGSGPAIAPLDPAAPRGRLDALLDALAPDALETPEGTTPLRASRSRSAAEAPPGVAAETAVVVATSGSTGEPKGVELSAAAMLHSARASLARVGARPGERWLCVLPTSHVSGLGVLTRSLVSGVDPAAPGHLDPHAGLAALGCEHVSLVPTQLRRLLDAGADLSAVRTILLGGAAAPPGLVESARAVGARVVTTYGMSETCGGCVYDGVPLDGVSVATDSAGRIRIAGPVVFSGYRGRGDLTARVLEGGWFITSDVGAVDGAGRLTVRGRADGMINTGGEKVSPDEVAGVLSACPGVREAAVVGLPDPEWGERVTAVVVPADPSAPPALESLRAHARARLPDFAAPRQLVLTAAIPLLASGKPDLMALRALSGAEGADGKDAGA